MIKPSIRTLALRSLLLALCASSGACVPKLHGIGLRDTELSLPETFGDQPASESDLAALRAREIFNDPNLVALIDEALRANKELEILRQEIHVTNAEIIAKRGKAFPMVDLGIGVGVEKVGRYTSQGAADASSEMTPGHEVPEHLGEFGLEFNATWEIDIWKKLRNATKAAQYRYLASIDGRNFVITGLVAEVTEAYYELMALDRQLGVVASNVGLLQEALNAVRLQRDSARVTELAVQRFDAELLKNQSREFDIRQNIVLAENRINLLLGRYPQPVVRSSARFLDTPLDSMEAGLPAQLLQRRPDIHAAELELDAAKLDVKVARAKFYPSLVIDAKVGIEAFSPEKLILLPASLLYRAAANLLTPLFNRTEIKAEYFANNAKQMQAVVTYEQKVLRAFTEVTNDLAAIDNADQGFALKAQQVARLEQAIDTSNQLFRSARADYLEVLTTRREALEAELDLVETKQAQISARIDLYRALGGGWPNTETSSDEPEANGLKQGGK